VVLVERLDVSEPDVVEVSVNILQGWVRRQASGFRQRTQVSVSWARDLNKGK